jgi:hypothetical protein
MLKPDGRSTLQSSGEAGGFGLDDNATQWVKHWWTRFLNVISEAQNKKPSLFDS